MGEFSTSFDLKNFPFDEQELNVVLVSTIYSPDEVIFAVEPKLSGKNEELSILEWSIRSIQPEIAPLSFSSQDGSYSQSYPAINYRISAFRHIGYYLWKVIVPLSLIVFMSWAVFWIDPSELGAQVGVSTASFLTLFAFQFSFGYLLPRVSYLTRIDIFVLGSTIIVFLALVESVTTASLAKKWKKNFAGKIDTWSRISFPLVFVFLIISAFIF
jgi:hypothetical protein